MSIDAMTDVAIRRLAPPPPPAVAREMSLEAGVPPAAPAARPSVTTYIPTEVLTLYVALVSAFQHEGPPSRRDVAFFWAFVGLTPGIVWVTYAKKLKAAGSAIPFGPARWPWWEMVAATTAYAAWAFALPDNPFARAPDITPAVGSFAVLVVSVALPFLAPLFQRR